MNVYGYWQYDDSIGLSCGIEKYDLVYVFKAEDGMVIAINENGKQIHFHKTHIAKKGFVRPSYEFHKICKLGRDSSKFYKGLQKHEHHKNDCHKCQMYKFKKVVAKVRKKKTA